MRMKPEKRFVFLVIYSAIYITTDFYTIIGLPINLENPAYIFLFFFYLIFLFCFPYFFFFSICRRLTPVFHLMLSKASSYVNVLSKVQYIET
jgi:hypothetical protein